MNQNNIYQKLALIQGEIGKIRKTELNKFQNYKFFTEFQALTILKPLLGEHKLTLTLDDNNEPLKVEELTTSKGGRFVATM